MPVQIGARPDSGFDDPIGMLTDCHRRIEQFLNILCVVADRAAGRALTGEESAAAQAALQYFRTGGQRHTADEEQSLFPRMRASGRHEGLSEIEGLEGDHQDANQIHRDVEIIYDKWITTGAIDLKDQDELLAATQHLKRLYTEHIRLEEQVVFPRAAQLLSPDAIHEIGQEFRARREQRS
jgi:hemerythrin-like domain-containing protein